MFPQPRPNRLMTPMLQPAERLPKSKSRSVRRWPNVSVVDAELVDEFAAKLKVKIDNKVAKKLF